MGDVLDSAGIKLESTVKRAKAILIINAGTNNLIQGMGPVCVRDEAFQIIRTIRSMNKDCIIFISGLLPRTRSQHMSGKSFNERKQHYKQIDLMNLMIDQTNQLLLDMCESLPMTTMIIHKNIDLCRDGLHTARLGIKKLASSIFDHLNTLNCRETPLRVPVPLPVPHDGFFLNLASISNASSGQGIFSVKFVLSQRREQIAFDHGKAE
ncbi:PREDICTED: uncharacterized protein LOC106810951 [Priapulus caudatus]|uniref:Uncharacterized protein LOC106810951 n=1 Tax=Priapulus caudatus TaxID=37621 RepID=A0ABM1ECJ9_PRICU|nr:PREDICTED: uncharacterized protein LOC106810951 [Priapulus caudatus]